MAVTSWHEREMYLLQRYLIHCLEIRSMRHKMDQGRHKRCARLSCLFDSRMPRWPSRTLLWTLRYVGDSVRLVQLTHSTGPDRLLQRVHVGPQRSAGFALIFGKTFQ